MTWFVPFLAFLPAAAHTSQVFIRISQHCNGDCNTGTWRGLLLERYALVWYGAIMSLDCDVVLRLRDDDQIILAQETTLAL